MTMAKRILVINPNSTEEVTREMDAALAGLRFAGGPVVDCVTLAEGPSGIESQADSDGVIAPLCRLIERASNDADAFVIACFSDPGVHAAREIGAGPVFGIAECGVLCAMTLGDRIGVISILERSVPRHARQFRALGVDGRIAGDSPINLGVVALGDDAVTLDRMTAVGTRLRDERGAGVLVMACAGMARYRARLEQATGLPVVDPTQAAVGFAIAAVGLGYRQFTGALSG